MHLLALSHVYMVPQLKQRCIKGLTHRLTTENVVDVLQLARLCDAPDLHLRCMKLLANNFKAVEATEGWKFLVKHDPWLELDILRFIDEHETVINLLIHFQIEMKFVFLSWVREHDSLLILFIRD